MSEVVRESRVTAPPVREDVAAPELGGLRVLLVHEWLYTWAGAERVLEQLVALIPHADVLAGVITPEMRARHPVARAARESWVGRIPGARSRHRWFLPLHALAFALEDTRRYDVIVSISHAFEKAIRKRRRDTVHVSYCLSPPRYLWDLSEAHYRMTRGAPRLALRAARGPLRTVDRAAAAGVDRFVSLSAHVAARVSRVYGRDSAVVHPPVAVKAADVARRPRREPFLLTLGRLVPYKRVDLAIHAAQQLGMPLVVAGDGPERRRLERIAPSSARFVGEVPDSEAADLMERCAAFIFCAEEDFGIAPVEANAHGAPVVAYGKGGAAETMRDGESAIFFREQTVASVRAAIAECLRRGWDEETIRRNAERFAPEHFREGMRRQILDAWNSRR